jgi:hypothetical protein
MQLTTLLDLRQKEATIDESLSSSWQSKVLFIFTLTTVLYVSIRPLVHAVNSHILTCDQGTIIFRLLSSRSPHQRLRRRLRPYLGSKSTR